MSNFGQAANFRYQATQSVAYTGTAGQITSAISRGVYHVRIWCSTDAHIATGSDPTATTDDFPVSAGVAEIMQINPGEKVSAIQQTSGGTLYVSECVF